jgi:hypothetical protein
MINIKQFVAKMLFGKHLLMSVYKDQNGNYYGGTIHLDKNKSHIDHVGHIDNAEFIGKTKIYI